MTWTDEDVRAAEHARRACGPAGATICWEDQLRSVMTCAVELASARSGTMTAGALAAECAVNDPGITQAERARRIAIFEHATAQGARIAELEADVPRWQENVDIVQRERDSEKTLRKQFQARELELEAEVDELRTKWAGATQNEAKALEQCATLQARLEAAEMDRDVARSMLAEKEVLLRGSREREATAQAALEVALKERQEAVREKVRHKQSALIWHKRVEQAAEALADVLPGEVGRLDLRTRIGALKQELSEEREERKRLAECASVTEVLAARRERDEARAELARLKPSGQVAEDVERIEMALCDVARDPSGESAVVADADSALSRLATKAQGYEAAVAEASTLRSQVAHHVARVQDALGALDDAGVQDEDGEAKDRHALTVTQRIAALAQERDEAEQRAEMWCARAGERNEHLDSALTRAEKAESEREAAVADNAAHVLFIRTMRQRLLEALDLKAGVRVADRCGNHVNNSHPGTALLEELAALREQKASWEEDAQALYGYTVFTGPCVHGRDPWDRCEECGEKNAVFAATAALNQALADNAALLGAIRPAEGAECPLCDWYGPAHRPGCRAPSLLSSPHPGGHSLERLKELEAMAHAVAPSVAVLARASEVSPALQECLRAFEGAYLRLFSATEGTP